MHLSNVFPAAATVRVSLSAAGPRQQQGAALIISLVMLLLIAILAFTTLRTSLVEEKISSNQNLAAKALFAAEHGVSLATRQLYDSTFMTTQLPLWETNPVAWYSDDITYTDGDDDEHPQVYEAQYQLRPLLNAADQAVTQAGISYYHIVSTGTSGAVDARASRMIEAVISTHGNSHAPFPGGLIGCDGIVFKSNATTSSQLYDDSTDFSIIFPATNDDPPGSGDKGDARTTNNNDHVTIDLDSNIKIEGELRSTGALSITGGTDAWVRRDVIANKEINLSNGFTIFGSVYTNSDTVNKEGGVTVHGEIIKGASVVPVPLVPYAPVIPCDPYNLSDTYFDEILADGPWIDRGYEEIDSTNNPYGDNDPDTVLKYRFSSKNGKDEEPAFFMKGSSQVQITGEVEFYLDGLLWIDSDAQLILENGAKLTVYVRDANTDKEKILIKSNAKVNFYNTSGEYGDPSNFSIITDTECKTDECVNKHEYGGKPDIFIDSNAIVFGHIYAPKADVKLSSNATVFGTVRGWHVTLDSNADFVYDEGLDSKGSGSEISTYRRIYINEKY